MFPRPLSTIRSATLFPYTTVFPSVVAEDISLLRLARLFAQREVLIFLAASALIQSSHAAYYGFSSLYWRASGIGETAIALLWAEGVVAEILFFALSRRFAGRLSPGTRLVGRSEERRVGEELDGT